MRVVFHTFSLSVWNFKGFFQLHALHSRRGVSCVIHHNFVCYSRVWSGLIRWPGTGKWNFLLTIKHALCSIFCSFQLWLHAFQNVKRCHMCASLSVMYLHIWLAAFVSVSVSVCVSVTVAALVERKIDFCSPFSSHSCVCGMLRVFCLGHTLIPLTNMKLFYALISAEKGERMRHNYA